MMLPIPAMTPSTIRLRKMPSGNRAEQRSLAAPTPFSIPFHWQFRPAENGLKHEKKYAKQYRQSEKRMQNNGVDFPVECVGIGVFPDDAIQNAARFGVSCTRTGCRKRSGRYCSALVVVRFGRASQVTVQHHPLRRLQFQ